MTPGPDHAGGKPSDASSPATTTNCSPEPGQQRIEPDVVSDADQIPRAVRAPAISRAGRSRRQRTADNRSGQREQDRQREQHRQTSRNRGTPPAARQHERARGQDRDQTRGKGSRIGRGRTGPLGYQPARARGGEQPPARATACGTAHDDQRGTGTDLESLHGHGPAGEGHLSAQAQHVSCHAGQRRRDDCPRHQARHTPTMAGITPGGKRVNPLEAGTTLAHSR